MDFLQHKKTVKEIFSIIDNLLLEQEYDTPEKFITEAISHFGRKKNGCLYIWNKGAC